MTWWNALLKHQGQAWATLQQQSAACFDAEGKSAKLQDKLGEILRVLSVLQ